MAVQFDTFYFDGLNFSSATIVYDDAALTTVAADGYYAQNGIVRQQLNGLLLNAQSCTTCATSCDSSVSVSISGQPGYFNADIDVGNTTGAVVAYFYMGSTIPDGVIGTFNNVAYNKLTSYKNHDTVTLIDDLGATVDYSGISNTTSVPDRNIATYVGNENSSLVNLSPHPNVPEYNLVGGSYVATGLTRSITVVNNQVGYAKDNVSTPSSPVFTMVVPKNDATETIFNLQIFAPLTGTAFRWEVKCPEELPSFTGSPLQASDTCATADTTYYFARNATNTNPFTVDTNTVPDVGNWVFTDAVGSTYANDTSVIQYIIVANTTALGIRNGVCVSSAACDSSGGLLSYTSSGVTNFGNICNDSSAPALQFTYYHSGAGVGPGSVYPSQGDVVYSDASGTTFLQAGYYYLYQDGTGDFHYIIVGNNGVVTTASSCSPPTVQFFRSGVQSSCSSFCNANYTIPVPTATTTNDTYANVVGGETIAGSSINDGWYAYAASSTNTATGTFRIMQVESNVIQALAECDNGICQLL
mgnify:FL=1|tara:strand:+ start:7976 stop:9559 length:1584 start_codon:yes stop_codon:yes gene_type:complete